jgi:hypothetical protein
MVAQTVERDARRADAAFVRPLAFFAALDEAVPRRAVKDGIVDMVVEVLVEIVILGRVCLWDRPLA